MFASLHRRRTHPNAVARLRRVIAALAVVTCGLLGWTGAVPAASARVVPIPDGPTGLPVHAPGGTVQVITAGGMPGWQIVLIAVTAALVAAAAAVFLDRARAVHRLNFRQAAIPLAKLPSGQMPADPSSACSRGPGRKELSSCSTASPPTCRRRSRIFRLARAASRSAQPGDPRTAHRRARQHPLRRAAG